MCEHCLSASGYCDCPTSDDSILKCNCATGTYCDVCGHYPKKSEDQTISYKYEEI